MSGFQKVINQNLAPAVAGDFASTNPRASIPPVLGGAWKVAAGQTVRVGYFAWGANDGLVYSSLAAAAAIGGAVIGFVARQPNEPSVVITTFLGEDSMILNVGMPCTLLSRGDYWASLIGAAQGAVVYALEATGAPSLIDDGTTIASGFTAASAAPVNAVTANTTTVAAQTGIMTVATVASGVIEVGQRVVQAGLALNTFVEAQLTGAVGGAGTYQLTARNRAAVAAAVATFSQGTLAKISR